MACVLRTLPHGLTVRASDTRSSTRRPILPAEVQPAQLHLLSVDSNGTPRTTPSRWVDSLRGRSFTSHVSALPMTSEEMGKPCCAEVGDASTITPGSSRTAWTLRQVLRALACRHPIGLEGRGARPIQVLRAILYLLLTSLV